jgi:magnesium transporter
MREHALTTQEASQYRLHTAGSVMETKVPVVFEYNTLSEVTRVLTEKINEFETINYIYVIDQEHKLKGVLSIKELFRNDLTQSQQKASEFVQKPMVSAGKDIDQEQVALLAIKHSIKAVPVVDRDGTFLGAVPSDQILNILHTEHLEDILLFSGIGVSDNPLSDFTRSDTFLHFKKRFPWLMFGLMGGFLAAFVVNFFEGVLAEEIALVAFIPAVVYMADAVGSQTQMIFIKTLALEKTLKIKSYIAREVAVNSLLAGVLGLVIFLISWGWLRSLSLSLILGISIFLTVIFSMFVAICLPWLLQKIKQDPATASGPPATVIRDIASLLIYFVVAFLIL